MIKTILVDAINTFIIKELGVYKEMHELLEKYPNKKIVLTNADDKNIKQYGLDKLPYELFTLKNNPSKTSSEYFTLMLNHFNLKAEDVVYFEHNLDAVISAQVLGIQTYHYDSQKKDLVKLKEFIDNGLLL